VNQKPISVRVHLGTEMAGRTCFWEEFGISAEEVEEFRKKSKLENKVLWSLCWTIYRCNDERSAW